MRRAATGVRAVVADVAQLVGLDRLRGDVLAAVVGHRLDLRRVVHVKRFERRDRNVDEDGAADADDHHADRVDLVLVACGT